MVASPWWWKACRCGEHIVEGLEKTLEELWLAVVDGVEVAGWSNVMARRVQALPQHAPALMPEREAEIVEIPENGAQCAQECHTQHHVVAI